MNDEHRFSKIMKKWITYNLIFQKIMKKWMKQWMKKMNEIFSFYKLFIILYYAGGIDAPAEGPDAQYEPTFHFFSMNSRWKNEKTTFHFFSMSS